MMSKMLSEEGAKPSTERVHLEAFQAELAEDEFLRSCEREGHKVRWP